MFLKKDNYITFRTRHISGEVHVPGRVLILAGGGGHTGFAYALAQVLHKKFSLSFLVPKGDYLSERRLRKFGKVRFLTKPRDPKTPFQNFTTRLTKAFIESIKQTFHGFDFVISTGSNFCIPPAIMAWTKGIPLINIEGAIRFIKPSKTAQILQPFSTITALQWKEQTRMLKGVVVGPIFFKPEIEPWNGGYTLVTGGTYGHKPLFDELVKSNLHNIVLQTGKIDPTPYIKEHPEWKVITITERFQELLAGAELVITHNGSTILEAVAYGKPALLVPNPEWTRTAGVKDAEYFARKVNAVLVSDIKLENLLDAIDEARKRRVPTLPNGAENLANMIVKLL